ncbi:hypothetical protein CEY12_00985 [Chryseobacterium sp. T16E-39]|uniref:DUF2480 family protein n=1 Tax=Chryseobacterium sp. T16E-39 TaxID=2015076 RepID=UPI000B5B1F0D|nr:DUF2480 family protein [Chryseobacterium sp. T16E-39]ASK28771.1 hypothetical protein CEY12_00985 [Chryseobacterium sp. T16E-39]
MEQNIFINKAEASGIVSFDIWDYKPSIEIVEIDLKEHLFMGMILKEKEFKESISAIDFSIYTGKAVAVICSTDAIIPPWAYMVLMNQLSGYCVYSDIKNSQGILEDLWKKELQSAELEQYKDLKVVVKARSETAPALYFLVTQLLKPFVKSLMYGEIGMPKVIFKK